MLRLPAGTARRFAAHSYLALPGFLPPSGLTRLHTELTRLQADARRRDCAMNCMSGSPRHMSTIGGTALTAESPFVADLYRRPDLLALLSSVTGEPVTEPRDVPDRHVVNILHHPADTNGGHTDDSPYALLLFLEAPADPDDGGLLSTPRTPLHSPSLRTRRCTAATTRPATPTCCAQTPPRTVSAP
ncbi:hypothetical protein [Streptomyces melanogenes]|uniref:Uncharacterized protein n=1 Tax=Streptomyces melanogenes TaxID=67326 RepID=A0ABZ1XB65_9ACTN|nr:hypothetical protein [Streptomyces melanogenes]